MLYLEQILYPPVEGLSGKGLARYLSLLGLFPAPPHRNCFRDFTSTMKAEQWHSKSMNGILQEFFTALWLMNFAKIEIEKRKKTSDFMRQEYTRANFKLVVDFLADNIGLALRRFSHALEKELDFLIHRSTEKRKKLSRSKPRQLRSAPSRYPYASVVERRA